MYNGWEKAVLKKKESIICDAISHSLQFSRSTAEIDCLLNNTFYSVIVLLALYELSFFKLTFKIRKGYMFTNLADGTFIRARTEAKRETAQTSLCFPPTVLVSSVCSHIPLFLSYMQH